MLASSSNISNLQSKGDSPRTRHSPQSKTELRESRSPFCLEPTQLGAEPRGPFLGRTEQEGEVKITSRSKTAGTGLVCFRCQQEKQVRAGYLLKH